MFQLLADKKTQKKLVHYILRGGGISINPGDE